MANLRSEGIESIIFSLSLNKVIKIKIIDATKTLAKAVSQDTFIPIHTV